MGWPFAVKVQIASLLPKMCPARMRFADAKVATGALKFR
jgi:hypothetical protein